MTEREGIITVCSCDMAGQVRGKGFPASQLERRRRFGIGWTPTNIMINCFGRIPATPFGSTGDLMLVPVDEGDLRIEHADGIVEHAVLGDLLTTRGAPWECCPRAFLKRALAELETAGFGLVASFEHEFWLDAGQERPGDAYAISKLRGVEPFIGELLGNLTANGITPDTVLPEYGPNQYEVTVDPESGLLAADHAVKLREICRALARKHEIPISFAPVVTRGVVGNGVHIHWSLVDRDGRPVGFDAAAPGGLSPVTASFAAGILRHAKAVCALTAPSVLSYERLKPHSWSAYYANLADRDREALLRICPYPEMDGVDVARRFNIEFRGADACASPYLQLGALVFAGLEGLRDAPPAPHLSRGDPGLLTQAERDSRGIGDLPRSLAEALDALEADPVAMGWLGPALSEAYLMHKRGEIAMAEAMPADDLLRAYAKAY